MKLLHKTMLYCIFCLPQLQLDIYFSLVSFKCTFQSLNTPPNPLKTSLQYKECVCTNYPGHHFVPLFRNHFFPQSNFETVCFIFKPLQFNNLLPNQKVVNQFYIMYFFPFPLRLDMFLI